MDSFFDMFTVIFICCIMFTTAFYMDGQNYSIAHFERMCERQAASFVLNAWKVPKAWINPSMTISPENSNRVIVSFPIPSYSNALLLFLYISIR